MPDASVADSADSGPAYDAGLDVVVDTDTGLDGMEASIDAAGIAIDSTNVYWTTYQGGDVMGCAINGCGGNPTKFGSPGERGIASDGANLYWADWGTAKIRKCSVNGCNNTPAVIASSPQTPWAIAVDSPSVYWADENAKTVLKLTPK